MRTSIVRLVLLEGGARLAADDPSPHSMSSGHARLVATMLAFESPRTVRVGEIADALWGERLPNTWETIVRQTIGRVRSWLDAIGAAGRSALPAVSGGYRLHLPPGWSTDVTAAVEAVTSAELRLAEDPVTALDHAVTAAGILDGRELLPLAEGDWVEAARRSLHGLATRAHEAAVEAATQLGDHRSAVAHAEQLIRLDPYREPFHRLLMAALGAAGDRAGALRAYDDLVDALAIEIDVAPSAATAELAASLRATLPTPPTQRDPWAAANLDGARFVGREPEAARLAEGWERARRGALTISLVSGEAGIGKTTLALHAAHQSWSNGATVMIGRCSVHPSMPYEPVVDAIASHLATCDADAGIALIERAGPDLARALPALGGRIDATMAVSDAELDRVRLFDAMASFIGGITADGPTMLILDDVQWASEATWQLVSHLVRRLANQPLHIVMSQRRPELPTGPLDRSLAELRRHPGLDEITLAGWTNAEAQRYLAAAAGAVDAARAELLRTRTGGNPFFITQLVRAERSGGHLDEVGGTDIPQGILDIVRHHQTISGEDATGVMQALAVAGANAEPWSWRRAVGLGDAAFADAVDAALATGLIREAAARGGRFEFTHALARDAVHADIPAGRRRRLHRVFAEGLEERRRAGAEISPADLARHYGEAAPLVPVDLVITSAVGAARAELRVGARDEAAERLEAVLPIATTSRARIDVLLDLATARVQLGDADVAHRLFAEAATLARSIGDGHALGRAAIGLTSGGRGASAWVADEIRVEFLEAALATIGDDDNPDVQDNHADNDIENATSDGLQVQLLGALAATITGADRWERRQEIADRAVAIAARSSDPHVIIASLGATRNALWRPEQTEQRLAAADRVLAEANRLGADEVAADAALMRISDLVVLGDRPGVEDALVLARQVVARLGMIRHRWELRLWEAGLALSDGRFDDARSAAAEASAMWGTEDQPDAQRAAAEFAAMTLLMEQDTAGTAAAMPGLAEAADTIGTYRCAQACALALVGRVAEASELLTTISLGGYAVVPRHSSWLFAMAMLAEAASIAGPTHVIAELRTALAPHAGKVVCLEGPNVPWGAVDHHLGLLCLAAGDRQAAEVHLRAALDLHTRFGAQSWRSRTMDAIELLDGP